MKDTFYFPHDYHARSDERLVKLIMKEKWEGCGLYWGITEKLHEAGGWMELDYDGIAFDLRADCERIKSVIENYDLFIFKGTKFSSKRVLENVRFRHKKKEKAKASAKARWNNRSKNANAMRTQYDGNAIKGKERKGKEIKGNNNTSYEVSVPHKNVDVNVDKTLEAIRLKVGIDGFTDTQKWKRIHGKNCYELLSEIGTEEFSRRLEIILQDESKRKRCNEIGYIFKQVKGFVEPNLQSKIVTA